jgi:hypothetical protein
VEKSAVGSISVKPEGLTDPEPHFGVAFSFQLRYYVFANVLASVKKLQLLHVFHPKGTVRAHREDMKQLKLFLFRLAGLHPTARASAGPRGSNGQIPEIRATTYRL